MQKSKTEPWMPADEYGRSLPVFTINLLVTDVAREVEFYKAVLKAECHYQYVDFAAVNVHGTEFMLHADHTYDVHPWVEPLKARERRGLGAELRPRRGTSRDRANPSFRGPAINLTAGERSW